MHIREEDLTAAARIRNAALEGFARNGIEATSVREVAKAAKVSAGLVQHHYKTKAELQQAVNDYVSGIAAEFFDGVQETTKTGKVAELLQAIGDRIMALVRDHSLAILYVLRCVNQGDRAGLDIFDEFMALANSQVERLARDGILRSDVDKAWTALHVVTLNLGTVLLEPAIDRYLERPFRDSRELERWTRASTQLFLRGVVSP
jgi:AcrR family transcriptional regulator